MLLSRGRCGDDEATTGFLSILQLDWDCRTRWRYRRYLLCRWAAVRGARISTLSAGNVPGVREGTQPRERQTAHDSRGRAVCAEILRAEKAGRATLSRPRAHRSRVPKGRRTAAYTALEPDIQAAGAEFVNSEAVVGRRDGFSQGVTGAGIHARIHQNPAQAAPISRDATAGR